MARYLALRPSDRMLIVLTLVLTVVVDLTVAIGVGVAVGLAIRLGAGRCPSPNGPRPSIRAAAGRSPRSLERCSPRSAGGRGVSRSGCRGEAARRHPAGAGALADPFLQLGQPDGAGLALGIGPAEPVLAPKVVASVRPPSLNFCSRTPLPLAISGSSSSAKTSSLRFWPTVATMSPSTRRQTSAREGARTFSTCLPARVWAITSSSGTMKPSPASEAISSRRPGWCRNSATISASFGRSTIRRRGSPCRARRAGSPPTGCRTARWWRRPPACRWFRHGRRSAPRRRP